MSDAPVVIVGAGLAGYTLARELRKLAPTLPVTLVSADGGAFYSKPMLSNALAQGHAPAALVQGSPADQAAKLGIEVRGHCRVHAIRRADKTLDTDAGPIPYGRLVLALGARPRRLAIPGGDLALSVNHLDDYARLRERLAPGAHVCILGAGLVGCEFANDLAASGYRVTLVEPDPAPLARMLPAPLSARLRQGLAGVGVDWHCGTSAAAIEAVGAGYVVTLADATSVPADLVLAATGLEPETELARAAGLAVGRGILADRRLATSDPVIYALGDCVEVAGMVLLYVLPLMQQARTLAANLAGSATELQLAAMPVAVKTPACPLVVCPPPQGGQGQWAAERDEATGAAYHFRDPAGGLLGFALAGDACGQRRQLASQVPPMLA